METKQNIKHRLNLGQEGQILVLAIVVAALVLVNTLAIIAGSQIFFQNANYTVQAFQALNLAEAGADKAIASLNATSGSYNGETATPLGEGEYSVSITNKNPTTKIIKSTGFIPSEVSPKAKRTVQFEVSRGIGAAFNYAIQVGDGGVATGLNTQIGGSVYSNGNIQMGLNTDISGDVYVAGGVQPNPDQQNECLPLDCEDFIFGKIANNKLDVAQSFIPSVSDKLHKVALRLKKFGSPPNLDVRIMGDGGGQPNRYDIKATGTLSASLVTENYGFVEVVFASPPTLVAGMTYWVMLDTSANSSNYWSWSADLTAFYIQGQAKWSPKWNSLSPIWNQISQDLDFKTYMGGTATFIDGGVAGRIGGSAHANILKNLHITGDAYYQAASSITAANYYPGSPDPGTIPMPLSDNNILDWKNVAEEEGVYSGDITNCPTSLNAGKYIGSLTPPGNCTILVDSPIWFTGDIILGYNTKIKLKESYGTSSGAFIADGQIALYWLDKIEGSGEQGSYIILISEFDSQNDPGNRHAITFSYKGNDGIVYANRGSILISWGNRLTSITGWKLILGFDTRIDYDEGLAGAFFSSGPYGAYSSIKGTYQLK